MDDAFLAQDIETVIHKCARDPAAGSVVSTAEAVEELRVLTGDFETSDEHLAAMLSRAALRMGCSVVLDEQAGADTLNIEVVS
ncbi:MAG TPA: hypothetical protein VMF90_01820 [Rhizobiaceae bacterium]|nr:hypothetical protein [Rhizobiaceae bacterium]